MKNLVFKFIVDGPPGSGKTTLLNRIINEPFNPDYLPTIGMEGTFTKKSKILGFDLTARFFGSASLAPINYISLYIGAAAVLLIFDIAKIQDENILIEYLNKVKRAGIKSNRIVLIGNKIDLCNKVQISNVHSIFTETIKKYSLAKFIVISLKLDKDIDVILLAIYNEKLIKESEYQAYLVKLEKKLIH